MKKQCNFFYKKNSERCKKDAVYSADSVFGKRFYCKEHARQMKNNMCIKNFNHLNESTSQ